MFNRCLKKKIETLICLSKNLKILVRTYFIVTHKQNTLFRAHLLIIFSEESKQGTSDVLEKEDPSKEESKQIKERQKYNSLNEGTDYHEGITTN